jgi:hypothetical protein
MINRRRERPSEMRGDQVFFPAFWSYLAPLGNYSPRCKSGRSPKLTFSRHVAGHQECFQCSRLYCCFLYRYNDYNNGNRQTDARDFFGKGKKKGKDIPLTGHGGL